MPVGDRDSLTRSDKKNGFTWAFLFSLWVALQTDQQETDQHAIYTSTGRFLMHSLNYQKVFKHIFSK
jgi:hypothetical protein